MGWNLSTPEELFHSRYKIDEKNGCWIWFGAKQGDGYGQLRPNFLNKKKTAAHRFAYELYYGPFDKNLYVCHKCDNPPCVNPLHLFLGTNRENMIDCVKKGRHGQKKGELSSNAKLKEHQILEIRKLYAKGDITQPELAKMFGTTRPNINSILHRQSWKHI